MIASTEAVLWHDRGRWWAIAAVVLTMLASTYVIVTAHVMTPLIPSIASLLGVTGRTQRSVSVLRGCAFLLMLFFVMLGLASIGFMFVPGLAAMIAAIVRTDS